MLIRVLFGFIFLVFSCCIVNSQICPIADDIKPCTCKEYPMPATTHCYNVTNTEMLMNIFNRSVDYPMINFILRDSNLMFIPSYAVISKKFEYIKIENTTMISIFDAVPEKPNSLKELFLINETKVQKGVEWNFFSGLPNLQRLEIKKIQVKEMADNFKDNVNSGLVHLTLSEGQITGLGDTVFANLKDLTYLQISYGKIQELKRSMFPNPSKLWYWDFNANRIENLPDDIFDNMPDLSMVTLSSNRFTTFSEGAFGDLYKRKEVNIYLEANPIVCDCHIKWYVPVLRFRYIGGKCAQPPSKEGKDLLDLKSEDFSYCNRFLN